MRKNYIALKKSYKINFRIQHYSSLQKRKKVIT